MSNSFIENVNYVAKLDNAFGDSASFTKTNISFRGSSADVKFSMSYYDNTDMKIKSIDTLMQNALYSDLTAILTQFKNSIELISGFTCLFTISNDNNAYLVSSISFSINSSDSEKKITKVNFNMTKNGIEIYDTYGKINNPIKILPHLALYDDILKSSIININTFKEEVLSANSNIISINTVSDSISHIITVSNNIDNVNSVATNIVPNLEEILQANTNASIATIKADEANSSALASATSASEASISATTASIQANTATNQATIATNQAVIATAQASSASDSASNALASEQNVANYLAAIEAIYDNFDDRYLGAYATDPLTDNDGNPLNIGTIYFNLTTNDVKFYNGTSWENPELTSTQAASNALSYMNSAQTAATNAQNSATASANSASSSNIYAANSQTSANSASTYASNAQIYATNSANSASASATSASNSEADRILAQTAASSASDSATSSQTSATASASSASSALSAKNQAESYASDANASKLAAANSATSASTNSTIAINKANEALVSADQASVSASTAVSAAANALINESNAEASMEKAEKWAEELENIEVEAGKYSAKHWALKSKLFANGSADNISYNGSISGLVSTNAQAAIDELDANIDLLDINKVDKITGKGLSTEDYTTAEKTKLSGIAASANNYVLPIASSTVLGGVKAGTNISIDANGVISANDTSVAWSEITSKPTTLSGYGITDAYTKTEIGAINTDYVAIFNAALV